MKTEQHKSEAIFKQKLEAREIQPSAQAWDRLDAMLSVGEIKHKKSNYTWIYIAAGFIGILLATIFFKQSQVAPPENKMVQQESIKTPKIDDSILINTTIKPTIKIAEASKALRKQTNKIQIVQNPETAQHPQNIIINESPIVQLSPNIEELLVDATTSPTQRNHEKITVDAKELLSQVDDELTISFREKVLSTVNKKYHDVKLVLATRNQDTN